MTITPIEPHNEPGIVRMMLGAGLDYVAWTQVIPAVFTWLFAIFFLAALLLVDMDARGKNPAEGLSALGEKFPLLRENVGPWIEARVSPSVEAATDPETGAVDLSKIDFYRVAVRIWLVLSLLGVVAGWLLRLVRGPRPPRRLRSKLIWAAGACGLLVLAYQAVYLLSAVPFDGSFWSWLFTFSGVGFFVFLFTAWGIVVSHALGRVAGLLMVKAQ